MASQASSPEYSSDDENVAEVENWLNSLSKADRDYYIKLLKLDFKAGKDLVACARAYKAKHEKIVFENEMRSMPLSDIKREYFPSGWIGFFQWLRVKSERYYIENKDVIDAQNQAQNTSNIVQQATQTGMERALNNANWDIKYPNYGHFGTDTGGRTRYR